jgi:hypothetical protein
VSYTFSVPKYKQKLVVSVFDPNLILNISNLYDSFCLYFGTKRVLLNYEHKIVIIKKELRQNN